MAKSKQEPIQVKLNHWRTPYQFRWRNATYPIDCIDRIWRHSQGEMKGQRLYRVRSRGKSFLLHYDREKNRWTLVRSPLRVRPGMTLSRLAVQLSATQ